MKIPWPMYLAWKHLFPSDKKVSFFSLLAIVGVALGVNVMIVVIAFMQGFQEKFRADIIDAQGHARVAPIHPNAQLQDIKAILTGKKEIEGLSSYVQGQLLVQNRDYTSIPHAIGIEPETSLDVLPINDFLRQGHSIMHSHDAIDMTPVPNLSDLDDGVVFVSLEVANRLGVRPPAILRTLAPGEIDEPAGKISKIGVKKLDPFVSTADWEIEVIGSNRLLISSDDSAFETVRKVSDGIIDLGFGRPVFEVIKGDKPLQTGKVFRFQCFKGSSIEVYSPSMITRAKSDELSPPVEVKVGGIIEVPWQGFHSEILFSTQRFMQDIQGRGEVLDGYYLKVNSQIAGDEFLLGSFCEETEALFSDNWIVVPWFVENAWFFELLRFEEYLMILIMIPIGLVAAFAIAIALMTSVLRKIKEIGLLVAMGGGQLSVGFIFCFQGLIIGFLGSLLGCGLALLFIRFRDQMMDFIVEKMVGKEGQAGVTQFYDFYNLKVAYPWESSTSMMNFISFAAFAIIVSTIAGLLPAWRAARLNPADALRSE